MKSSLLAIACSLAAGLCNAQLLRYCTTGADPTCFSFVRDQANDTTGIFMQVKGPTSKSYIAIGQGREMKGSQMFVLYANAAGNNITISRRTASGHSDPTVSSGEGDAILLEGSGIEDGMMTANIMCNNCNAWKGGSMDFKGSNQAFIYASKSGSLIKSDSTLEHIEQHDDGAYNAFTLDLSTLTPSQSSNPFLEAQNAQVITVNTASATLYNGVAIPLHGAIMGIAFLFVFPVGSWLIRLASFRNLLWVHAGIQILSYFGALLGLALGVYIATRPGLSLSKFHPTAGIVIVVLLTVQPVLGWLHHLRFKHRHTKSVFTTTHVWYGRVLIICGMVDGIFGLLLAGQSAGAVVGYGVVMVIILVLWIFVLVLAARKSRKEKLRGSDYRMAALANNEGSE